MKRKLLLMAFIISFSGMIITHKANAQNKDFQLIEQETSLRPDITTALHFFENKDAVTRFRDVQVNENVRSLTAMSPNDQIVLNLFPDTRYLAQVQRVEEIMEGNVTITAKLLSFDYAFMVIATTEGRTLTTIFIPEKGVNYQIISDPVTLNHYLLELNPALMPEPIDYPALIPGELTPEDIKEQERIMKEIDYTKSGPSDPAVIDVMIVYTPAARTWGNSNGGIFNLIATAVAIGNTAHANSSTILTIRLVHNAEISYTESGDVELDLNRLTGTSDGYMDNVHTLRNTYGADLVQLFSTMGGGIAWVLGSSAGDPAGGFSCAGVSTATAYTPIHEMGHNMSCGHHKQQNFQAGPGGIYSYSAGWRWQGTDGVWYSSVMSYTAAGYFPSNPVNSTRVGYFSNPSINFMGVATGHTTDGDNARAIRNTKHVIAAYRSTATINCIACPSYDFTITPGNSWATHSSSFAASGCKMYRISVEQGRTYTFKTGCGNGATATFDTYLHIYDNNCDEVTYNDDGCEDARSIVTWMATYTGYAYLKVRGYSSYFGSYTLAYQRTDELTWQGTVSTNWNTAGNWDGNVVPDNTFDVIIPTGATKQPYIYTANASCKSLTINSGATLTLGGYTLNVSNNMNITGTLAMNNASGIINAYGDVYWNSGSAANFTANSVFLVHGSWEFKSGSNANLANGVVAFTGATDKYVRCYSSGSSFNNLSSYKSTGYELGISGLSNQPLTINGNIYVHTSAKFGIYSSYDVFLKGNVNSNSTFICNYGKVVLDGADHDLRMNTGDYFNNLTFSQTGTVTINNSLSSILEVKGNVVIESGVFNMQDRTMRVGGNWTNTSGTAAFNEGTGTSRVIFNGTGHQYVYSNETFNILEAAMVAALRVNNAAHTVTCNQYHWTSGGIDVVAGTFTALDLAQNGLYGGFWVNPGGTINITNSTGSTWVDLRGSVHILGGTMNLTGTYADWPYANGANFTMTGGVLDIKTCNFRIFSGNTWTYNITGGTIRLARGYESQRADFTPAGGTVEFYGTTDWTINQVSGSTLRNVKINKTAKEGGEDNINGPVYDERSGELLSDGGKANTITLNSNFVVTGDLTVEAGSFSLGSFTCSVAGTTTVYGHLIMNNPANDLTANDLFWDNGSTANVTAGTFHTNYWFFKEGTTAKIGTGNTAYVKAVYFPTSNDAEHGNLVMEPFSKIITDNSDVKAYYPVRVMGNLLIKNGAIPSFWISGSPLLVAGNAVIESGASIAFSAADFEVGGTLNLAGTLHVTNGRTATIQGELTFPASGWFSLNNATFTNNYNAASGFTTLSGKLTMNAGSVAEFPGRSISISASFVNEISGGTLRFGRTLSASSAGNFQLNAGTVGFISSNSGHYIQLTNGNFAFNMLVNKPSGSLLIHDDLTLKGNLTIDAGVVNSNNKTIQIAGDWTNNVGTAGFNEGTGRVIFNGSAGQFCSTEEFNILEVNKPTELLYNISGHNITCQVYDWTSGGIWISPGNFTAYDLADDGLFGTFAIFGGTMNLHQDNGQYIDFAGDIIIGTDGILNVYGGSMRSYWPFFSNASLTMSGGAILDIKDQGIYVYDTPTWTFTTNITGGTIKTSRGFESIRADFTPTAGTFEFYGSNNAYLLQSNGSTLNSVLINKSAKGDGGAISAGPEYDHRSGKLISDGSKANTVFLNTNFTITNNLTLSNGSLTLNNKTLNVNRNCYIQGTLNMTQAADVLNVGTYWVDWLEFQSGSSANVTNGTINCYGWIIPRAGSSFNLGIDNTVYIKGESSGGLSNFEPSATYGNVVIAKNAGNYAVIDGVATQPIIVNGNFTMSADNTFRTQNNRMTVHGICTDVASSTIYVLNWAKKDGLITSSSKEPVNFEPPKIDFYLEIDTDFTLNGALIINNNGKVLVHGEFASAAGSSITINNGSFIADSPNHPDKGWEYLNGNLTMTNGLFEITNNSTNFGSSATSSISGGVIRSGGAFHAVDPGVFQPTGGVVEITGANPDASIYCYNGNHFYNLLINRNSGYSLFQWGYPVMINNNLTIQNGELRTGSSQVSVAGNVEVNNGAKLLVTGPGSLLMGASRAITINSNGVLALTGSAISQPKISIISTGNYALNVESGATLSANNAIFEYMNAYGVNVKSGALVDPANAFTSCIFRLGQSGGRLLMLNNNQTLVIQNAIFPGSPSTYNVSKNLNTGVVTFVDYSGAFSGAAFEQDPFSRLHWTGTLSSVVNLDGVNIAGGQSVCFEALQTITTGGSDVFVVENGASANLVAGQNILMLPGTHAQDGSYFHAWISSTGFCSGLPLSMIASKTEEEVQPAQVMTESLKDEGFFKVYPNPTRGTFVLELTQPIEATSIRIEILTMLGERLLSTEQQTQSHYQFDLSNQNPGIYFIRVMNGGNSGIEKLIRQ